MVLVKKELWIFKIFKNLILLEANFENSIIHTLAVGSQDDLCIKCLFIPNSVMLDSQKVVKDVIF